MAFSKSDMGGSQQGEGLVEMTGKPATSFGSVGISSSFDQGDHQVMDGSHNTTDSCFGHTSSIFLEGYITAIVESSFDEPMLTSIMKQVRWRSLCSGQAGEAEFGLTTAFDDLSFS